jgi:phage terminase large subunit-like protein
LKKLGKLKLLPPPDFLDAREEKVWLKLRKELAHDNIPTPADAELLGYLAQAKVQYADWARHVKICKYPKGITAARALLQKDKWFEKVRLLTGKCGKFLRGKDHEEHEEEPDNAFNELLEIDIERVDDKKIKSKFVDAANQYAAQVVSGKIPACKELRAACQRHINDLERAKGKDFDYKFSVYLADRVCRFISMLPHVKGKWAKHKELLKLEGWECFIVCSLFGWVSKHTNLRRFTEAYLEICRKNGKSILAAAIGLYMFCADGEHGAEVYSGATTEKQAWEVFRPARLMAAHSPELVTAAGISVNAKSLIIERDGSRFEPIIGKPGDGASPSCAIADEYHEHDTPDLVDTMTTGMLAREQPLMLNITTAGFNLAGPCYEHRTKAKQVLDGALENERLFAVIYTLDLPNESTGEKGDDWADPASLAKTNPNLGISVDKEFLLASQRSAVLNVAEQTKFKTKHLNIWCAARNAWVSLQQWQALGDAMLKPEELKGADCWLMFDLASKLDIAASMMLFRKRMNEMNHYYIFGKYYLPEEHVMEPSKNQLMYQKWHKKGLLTLTAGATTDFEQIKDEMVADAKIYNPREVVYDPFNATHMSQLLMDEGLTLVEFTQKPQNFAVPMDEVQAALKDKRLHHDNNEIMTWMMANVTVRPAKKGLFWPTKEAPEHKIDGPVAMIMGIARAMADNSDAGLDQFLRNPVTA